MGMPKASQSQMKRAALSALSTKSTPPLCLGWLATMPMGLPSMRAKAGITPLAKSFFSSKREPSSISSRMSANMSKNLFWSGGMISSRRLPLAAGAFAGRPARGGGLRRLDRQRRGEVFREVGEVALRRLDGLLLGLHQHVAAAGDGAMHARAPQLFQRHLLADDHLGHALRAQVHGGVAVPHHHDVAEGRDVRAARRAGAEEQADLRDEAAHLALQIEDAARAPAAGEHLDLVGDARPP